MITVREPEHARRRRREKVKRPPYRKLVTRPIAAFILVAATSNFAMGAWEVVWSLWLRRLGASMTYIYWTWIVFSVPMLLSFVGGYLADRYNRFALMFSGYAFSAVAWIMYGATRNLTLFITVNGLEGIAVAYSYPAKQSFLVQVSPPRWLGAIQGLEGTSMQLAALIGTLTAPLLYQVMGGYVISMGGVLAIIGLTIAAPILRQEWARISATAPGSPEAEPLADRNL